MVTVAIHQPNHLPYLGFFDKMANSDIFILYDNTQFAKYDIGFQSRNKIRIKKGWIWLTVPVSYNFGALINQVNIKDQHWRKTHWKSIEANYSRAKYFKEYKERFKAIYDKEWDNLSDLNIAIIRELASALGIRTKTVKASELIPELNFKATDALVALCKAAKAEIYLSGVDGEKYLEHEKFRKAGIKIIYQHYKHPEYSQVFPGFEPYMSALDLLFNHGPESLKILKNEW